MATIDIRGATGPTTTAACRAFHAQSSSSCSSSMIPINLRSCCFAKAKSTSSSGSVSEVKIISNFTEKLPKSSDYRVSKAAPQRPDYGEI
jgi:hypothetical protein